MVMKSANAESIHKLFRSKKYVEAIDELFELAETDVVVSVRLFLLYRPEMHGLIRDWSKSIDNAGGVFLEYDMLISPAPETYKALTDFQETYASDISDEYQKHSDKFTETSISAASAEGALKVWETLLPLQNKLDIKNDENKHNEIEQTLVELIKKMLINNGKILPKYSDIEFRRRARVALVKNADLSSLLQEEIRDQRHLLYKMAEIFEGCDLTNYMDSKRSQVIDS